MQISLNTSKNHVKWYDRPWAAFIFFTRLPLWRIYEPHRDAYQSVVEYWPMVGWLSGGLMGAVLYACSLVMPYSIAVVMAIIARILLTGALHEDGLADFIDGFGAGGRNRLRILRIMKDSNIGTYGVLGLVFYVLLLYLILSNMPPLIAALSVLVADSYAKMIASQLIVMLPYARTEEESKAHNVYRPMGVWAGIGLTIQGLLPMGIYLYFMQEFISWQYVVFIPCVVMYALYLYINKKLRGYTGDCCGAVCLLVELCVLLTIILQLHPQLSS